jgi:gamma-glutamylaminecyclotransferase
MQDHIQQQETFEKIFVYGTLKKNEPNNHILVERNAKFCSQGLTVDKWPLIIATKRNVPFLLNTNEVGKVN